MTILAERKLGFIGGGNMAEAIIKGLCAGGVAAAAITVAEPVAARREYLAASYGVRVSPDNGTVLADCDTVVIAVKPQVFSGMIAGLERPALQEKLLISIMAGVTIDAIEDACAGPVRVVRVMPNTPALVLAGATAICRGGAAGDADLACARQIFELVGTVCEVEEKLMDAVTGLSGSGPAYVFTFVEALADAGVKNGLPRETANRLAIQTVLGAARLLSDSGDHPAVLRDKVTSPGGTTIAAQAALERHGFRSAVLAAVDAAVARSAELGRK
ncbi:pyrroline-5-carboxylate reductase [Geotalea uraniireducens]|uniref:Pyrroline-5-carboxylate reductase n=1 Tax=Geotalea uraniireducens TaxID=351604 RepID=A0ABM8ENN3_9BACT|nr:pyrroline-5-carboxylate reductase [Geotalea uraniireducens]BDV44057.1 pyrroline-5-carboxylate reductase [Geotalea uraniireducens]